MKEGLMDRSKEEGEEGRVPFRSSNSLLVFFPMINDLNAGGSLWRFWAKRIPH